MTLALGHPCIRRVFRIVPVVLTVVSVLSAWTVPAAAQEAAFRQAVAEAAAQEVWEEAGARGTCYDVCLGLYSYKKWVNKNLTLPIIVAVFPIKVRTLEDDYPEAHERKRRWFSLKKAAAKVEERDLRQLIATFTLDRLK